MKSVRLIGLILLISYQVKADIIYVPHTDQGTAISIEGIAGVEQPFSKHNSANFWGGFGVVSMVEEMNNPALKGEIAVEIKHYFSKSTFSGFNLGLYSGFAYLNAPVIGSGDEDVRYENLVGFVPGLKLSYTKKVSSSFQLEPYIGVSTPWYSDDLGDLFEWISTSDPGFILTLGFRIGLNKLLH